MSIFCGKTCKCKNRCEADLRWNTEAMKGCKSACKSGNPPSSGFEYLERFPDEFQDYYTAEIDLASELVNADGTGGVPGNTGTSGNMMLYIVLGLLLVVAAWFFIFKK